jgi:hypothetical protein
MTLTVKLDAELESALERRCSAEGTTKRAVVQAALREYLARTRSPYELGKDLFGRYASRTGDLSRRRRELYAGLADAKRRARG